MIGWRNDRALVRSALQFRRRWQWWHQPHAVAIPSLVDQRWFATEPSTMNKLVKRKVALVAGYLGTGYHGVQLNKDVMTIENELRQAIFKAGAVRESNAADLAKIDWSRSSRTDKGVHAGCIVFSGKLLIDEENNVDPVTGRVKGLAEALNASLPPTIRIFSCTRVNKRFSARKNCVLREYEYFMPLKFLQESVVEARKLNSPLDVEEAVEEFCRALRRYEGIHDFHNFTKSRSHFYKQQAKTRNGQTQSPTVTDDDNAEEDEEEEEEVASIEIGDEPIEDTSQYANEEGTIRKTLARHRRSVYSCSGSLIHDFYGEPYLRVHIVGQAFLLNQIRCMVGGALAVATKGISRTIFDAALDTNRIVRIPIAPAEGLVLLSSSFGGKLHTVSLYADPNTALAKERKDLSHRILLNRREDEAMTKFREDVIYKEVVGSWDVDEKMDRWLAYLERAYESNDHLDEDELAASLREVDALQKELKNKRHSRIHQNRLELTEGNVQRGLLPKQFTTKLCVRFAVAPGIFTSDLRRGVAKHLKMGKIPLEATEEQVLDYIDQYGVQNLAKEGRRLRLSIQR